MLRLDRESLGHEWKVYRHLQRSFGSDHNSEEDPSTDRWRHRIRDRIERSHSENLAGKWSHNNFQAQLKGGEFANTFVGKGHEGAVASVSVCPNVTSSVKFCSGSWDKSIKIWDSESKQVSFGTGKKKRKIESEDLVIISFWKLDSDLYSGRTFSMRF